MRLATIVAISVIFWGTSALSSLGTTVGYWRFEEASGDTADVAGTAGLMTAFNSPARSSTVPVDPVPQTGASNTRSFLVDGTDDVFATNAGIILNNATDDTSGPGAANFTVEAWIKPSPGMMGFIVGKSFASGSASEDRGFQLIIDANGIDPNTQLPDPNTYRVRAEVRTTAGGFFQSDAQSSGAGLAYDQWHHVAMVRDGDDLTMYVDGNPDFTRTGIDQFRNFSSRVPYTIGAGITGGTPGVLATFGTGGSGVSTRTFDGLIDEVRISNEPLDPTEFLNAALTSSVTWNPSSGAINNPGNWTPQLVPNISRIGVIGGAGQTPESLTTDVASVLKGLQFDNVNSHSVGGTGSLTLESAQGNAILEVDQGHHELQLPVTLNSNLDVDVETGGRLDIDNQLSLGGFTLEKIGDGLLEINSGLSTGINGTVLVTAGTLGGVGTIAGHLNNATGSVAPGNDPGRMKVTGDYLQQSLATLQVDLGGTTPLVDHDVLEVAGSATLDGTLDITLDSFSPAPNDSFTVLTAASITDQVLQLTGSGSAGFSYSIVGGTDLVLTFTGSGNDADFDGSTLVDGHDFLIWQRGFPDNSGTATNGDGDANGDGNVLGDDLQVWQTQFGGPPPLAAANSNTAPVPEPSSIVLLGSLLASFVVVGRTMSRGSKGNLARPIGCLAAAMLAMWATNAAHATFTIDGEIFTEIFEDDLSGTGLSEGDPDENLFTFDTGTGLDLNKWTWGMRRAARIERDGGGSVLVQSNDGFPSGFTGNDDVDVSSDSGLLAALSGASQWGYEVLFTVNENPGGTLSSATHSAGILVGKTAAAVQTDPNDSRDVSVVVRNGSNGLEFDLFHSTGLMPTADATLTPLATGLTRGQQYTLGVHHVANDQVNYYLDGTFRGTLTSNNSAPPESVMFGDVSGTTHVDLSFNSYKVGTTPGGTPTTEFDWFTDSSGSWNQAINWMFGVPNTNQRTAMFGSVITADRTVNNNQSLTVNTIRFDNANAYVITGPGNISLEADTGDATIDVVQGSHEFQQDVILQSSTDLVIANGAVLSFNNELDLNGLTLTKMGTGTLHVNNRLTGGGTLDCQVGNCFGTGIVTAAIVNSSGTVSPGNRVGTLEILGDYSQGNDAALLIEIGGTGAGTDHDHMTIYGTSELSGQLDVTLTGGFEPAAGDSFDILDWGQLSGSFDDVDLPALSAGLNWDASQLYTTGSLSVAAVPEASTLGLVVIGLLGLIGRRVGSRKKGVGSGIGGQIPQGNHLAVQQEINC